METASHVDLPPGVQGPFEVFVNGVILELESLGPLVDLAPGATVTHEETWHVFSGVSVPDDDEAAHAVLDRVVATT